MSFEVDWFKVCPTLFRQLSLLLIDANRKLCLFETKLFSNLNSKLFQTNCKLFVGMLDLLQFKQEKFSDYLKDIV